MKRAVLGLTLALTLVCSTGCELLQKRKCNNCNGNLGCRPCKVGWQRGGTDYQRFLGNAGSYQHGQSGGTAQVAYPYYTNRGPRDFLATNPPSIGP